jgi:hypothetical protein
MESFFGYDRLGALAWLRRRGAIGLSLQHEEE